jgi:hypothetical protein
MGITQDTAIDYSINEWKQIAQIITANWVYDLAKDFAKVLPNPTNQVEDSISEVWLGIETWWQNETQSQQPILDRNSLSSQSQELLEQLAKRIRSAWFAFDPVHDKVKLLDIIHKMIVSDSSSNYDVGRDPFGSAITALLAQEDVQQAYQREARYAATLFVIENALEQGNLITDVQRQQYLTARADVLHTDFQILAQHQVSQLNTLFKSSEFIPAKFAEGIWRMTLSSQWDYSPLALWHWLRFIDNYVAILENQDLPLLPV